MVQRYLPQEYLWRTIVGYIRERSFFFYFLSRGSKLTFLHIVATISIVFIIIFCTILFMFFDYCHLISSPYYLARSRFLINFLNFLKTPPLLFFILCFPLKIISGCWWRAKIFKFQKSNIHRDIVTFSGKNVATDYYSKSAIW